MGKALEYNAASVLNEQLSDKSVFNSIEKEKLREWLSDEAFTSTVNDIESGYDDELAASIYRIMLHLFEPTFTVADSRKIDIMYVLVEVYKQLNKLFYFGLPRWPDKASEEDYQTAHCLFKDNINALLDRLSGVEFYTHFRDIEQNELFFKEDIAEFRENDTPILPLFYSKDEEEI